MDSPSPTALFAVSCPAEAARIRNVRHALRAFLTVVDADASWLDDVLVAVGETLANVVEHAYDASDEVRGNRQVEMEARVGEGRLTVEIADRGHFIQREPRANRGFGLRIARAIASDVAIDTSNGTRVRLTFVFVTAGSSGGRRSGDEVTPTAAERRW